MKTPEDKKTYIWEYFSSIPKKFRPNGLTNKKLEKIKSQIFENEDFWDDIYWRHGLNKESLEELLKNDIHTFNHCVGNFWGMISEIMWKKKMIK